MDANDPYHPLVSQMRADLLANAEGGVWILHDKPLPDVLKWVDFDPARGEMVFAYQDGRTQALGIAVPSAMKNKIAGFNDITVMLQESGEVTDFAIVPLNIAQI